MTGQANQPRVLVTGAGSGLGLALVRQFVRRGARVLATDIHPELPTALAGLPRVSYLRLDVTKDSDWVRTHDWVVERWGGLDYLFNNAGVAATGRIELTEIDQWQWIIDINLLGVVRGCRTFASMMMSQGRGHIVNTASVAGLVHPPGVSEYSAVKAGVVGMSESLFHELKPFGVQVSVVCPTFFRTNLAQSLRGRDERAQKVGVRMIEKASTSAEEVALAILKGTEKRRHLIVIGRDAKLAYAMKRFARPLYYRMMAKQAEQMARRTSATM
jgi:NAD(P)-dependent dehydrogenase (short-subunit alcohol dehydrogenase family)